MVKKVKSKRLKLIKMGNKLTSRYFDSLSVVSYELITINDDGLMQIIGRYNGRRTFRYFFREEDKVEQHKKVIDMKRDILAEFSALAQEQAS